VWDGFCGFGIFDKIGEIVESQLTSMSAAAISRGLDILREQESQRKDVIDGLFCY